MIIDFVGFEPKVSTKKADLKILFDLFSHLW